MKSNFKSIKPGQIQDNVFKLIGSDWMLITAGAQQCSWKAVPRSGAGAQQCSWKAVPRSGAGTKESFNTMTASWGAFGRLWDKQIAICFVRPTRYTFQFLEKSDYFTLCFFEEKYRKALNFCGSKSGRNVDKIAATGLTAVEETHGIIYFAEARLVIQCKKIYFQDLNPAHFILQETESHYPSKDYHRTYIGEILKCLLK